MYIFELEGANTSEQRAGAQLFIPSFFHLSVGMDVQYVVSSQKTTWTAFLVCAVKYCAGESLTLETSSSVPTSATRWRPTTPISC